MAIEIWPGLLTAVSILVVLTWQTRRMYKRAIPPEPRLPQMTQVISKQRKDLQKRARYFDRCFRRACIAVNVTQKDHLGNGEVRYRPPRLGSFQINPETEVYRAEVASRPINTSWHNLTDGRLIDELSATLHVPVEIRKESDGHYLYIHDGPPSKPEPLPKLPALVKYEAMLPLPEAGCRLPVGVDADGKRYYHDLAASGAPHVLVGGATGSGKSVLLNTWLTTLVTRHSPAEIQLLLIDLKQIELSAYETLPHCQCLATEEADALQVLDDLLAEVKRRYGLVKAEQRGGIPEDDVAARVLKDLPRLVLVIDELAEMTLSTPECVTTLIRVAQLGRAAKLNIIAATQRPSVDVCPGTLKTNFEARVALALPTQADSRVILDTKGAEELEPPGQAIYKHGNKLIPVMTPFLTAAERGRRLKAARDGQRLDPDADEVAQQETLNNPNLDERERLVLEIVRQFKVSGQRPSVRKVYGILRGKVPREVIERVLKQYVKR
jgi:DNA segregation ATPase FtsK/SpoIIIE-like protein